MGEDVGDKLWKEGGGRGNDHRPTGASTSGAREGGGRGRGWLSNPHEATRSDEFAEVFGEVFFFEHTATEFGEGGVLNLADAFAGHV